MRDRPAIIRDNQTLATCYQQLKKNDIICGRICLKPGEEHLLLDLLARGIHLIPSALSQLASRSKAFQARIFSDFMLPGTLPIYDNHALLNASSLYKQQQYTKVVLKCDRKNAGLGIYVFNDIEEISNQIHRGSFPFPFVIQPFQVDYRDIRVIVLGDYLEAYERVNPGNFKKNLHCGGKSIPYTLGDQQRILCEQVMRRGEFPYAHLDLMLKADGKSVLAEINLRGGLRGAKICAREYLGMLDRLHEQLLSKKTTQETTH